MRTTSLTPNIAKPIKIPKRNDDRIILHFDYDCFYASVFENENPSLKSQPLGIKQKSILATCNYVARARGVKKLMLISEAQKICPDLILMNGEDLTRFRDVSKKLWAFLRAHSWNRRVERLGLDEVFLDVTDVIAYNRELLNVHALGASFFQLDSNDPVKGFAFDGSRFYGCVQPDDKSKAKGGFVDVENPLCVRLMLASHLAGYLRHRLDGDFGYTSSGGISTNKLLAKLAGSVNKPDNQTTLLAIDGNGADAVEAFMDAHSIRKVPGIGSRIAQLMEEYLLSRPAELRDREGNNVTVGEARRYPGMSSDLLEQILDRPGAERGSGEKVWNFLHGIDPSEVKEASDVPTQISIEDTYMSRPLQTPAEVNRELHALATSLIRRMRVDLTEADIHPTVQNATSSSGTPRWLAYPKTLRLSTRTKTKQPIPTDGASTNGADVPNFSRSSRSAPLPSFVFHFSPPSPSTSSLPSTSTYPSPATLSCEEIASRLVTESLLPLFRRLHPSRSGGWNLALLNICVTNMVLVARDESSSGSVSGSSMAPGRDIGRMFRAQEDKLREWTVYDTSSIPATAASPLPLAPSIDIDINPAPNVIKDTTPTGEDIAVEDLVMAEEEEEDDEECDAQFQGRQVAMDNSSTNIPLLDKNQGDDEDEDGDDTWEEDQAVSESHRCQVCGHAVPAFAMSAHERFHAMNE
ncbi:hypothetical protein F5B22DRAFT_286646 [Xylaria bambusicola]|uniref:uncharacterized protein n=1 Tax=Xylaria bambusicola TaxID=326684 RepID=UPI002007B9C4|nr:uncharacterized protein F5B22DRAFT_286646 [Xylaria bambusicola]KAI0512841.1 hypothetical protein F5B22DRAFT_286646 [Xylaria bambusicola]